MKIEDMVTFEVNGRTKPGRAERKVLTAARRIEDVVR